VREAYGSRVELKAAEEGVQAARSSVTVVRRGQLPRLDGFAEYEYANPNQRIFPAADKWDGTWMAGLALTWAVNETFSNGALGRELAARQHQAEAQVRALHDGIRMEVSSAWVDERKSEAALESAQRGAIAARAAYDVASELYRVGKATTAEVIDAEGELVNAQLQLINAHIDRRVAAAKLSRALGRKQ